MNLFPGGKPRNLPTLKDADIEVQKRTLLFRNVSTVNFYNRLFPKVIFK